MELDNWQQKLDEGAVPNFGDLHKLGKSSKAVYKVLEKNGLV